MRRVLAFLLPLAIVAAITATPAAQCVSTPTLGSDHGCCGEQAAISAPTGPCCFLSQPANDRTLTASRHLSAKERHAEIGAITQATWAAVVDTMCQRRATSTSPPGSRPVPIYIQQLSLLI